MKRQQPNTKPIISLIISLFLSLITLNPVHATTPTPPAGSKIYPKFSNATSIELVGGSQITATWPAPSANTFKLWVQIPTGSNASNATYLVYPKGNAIGSNACDSSSVDYPCYPITVDQTTAVNGWVQLRLNNLATTSWPFTKAGFVTISANSINNTQQLGVAQVSYQAITPTPTLTIGQTYQGGKIFYLDSTKQHGLIAAPSDQSAGIQWYNGSWINTGATGTAIGTGKANTTAIVQAQGAGSYAAKLCDDLVLGGYSDWYLPSKDELNELYKNKTAVGGFADNFYWSSSEFDYYSAWNQDFESGYQYGGSKVITLPVRAVRAF